MATSTSRSTQSASGKSQACRSCRQKQAQPVFGGGGAGPVKLLAIPAQTGAWRWSPGVFEGYSFQCNIVHAGAI